MSTIEPQNVTMSQVAESAGVSTFTVSQVVNNRNGVHPKTARRVRAAIAQLGYVPAPAGSRRGPNPRAPDRTRQVGFIAFNVLGPVLHAEVYNDLSLAIEHALADQGYAMVTRRIPPGGELSIDARQLDGALVLGCAKPLESVIRGPVVQVLGTIDQNEDWDHISCDEYRIGAQAAEYLLRRGHRCCALLADIPDAETLRTRHRGFVDTLRDHDLKPLVLTGPALYLKDEQRHLVDVDGMRARLKQFMAAEPRPTGMFIEADMLTAGFYPLLYADGIEPGRDLDIISCNNEQSTLASLAPRPSSICQQTGKIAQAAVERLLYRLDHPDEPAIRLRYEPTIVGGNHKEPQSAPTP